jgi:hypothetical protein
MNDDETMTKARTAAGTFKAEREPGEALSRDEIAGMLSDILKILHSGQRRRGSKRRSPTRA